MSACRLTKILVSSAIVCGASVLAHGCNLFPNFKSPSVVDSVRVLAVRADKPYSNPGDTVKLEILALDGRANKPRPMKVFWLPFPCMNPRKVADDCYPGFADHLQPHADLTSVLPSGDSLSIDVPLDAIGAPAGESGQLSYGRMVVFEVACAGHVEYLGKVASLAEDAVPLGCFDEEGNALGQPDFMVAYAVVSVVLPVVPPITNQNPVIEGVLLDRQPVDPAAGITLPHCTAQGDQRCSLSALSSAIPETSWEENPFFAGVDTDGGTGGAPGDTGTGTGLAKENIWVEYYVTQGSALGSPALAWDSYLGRVNDAVAYRPPKAPGEGVLYAVVRDDRGGVSWWQTALHIQ